MKRTLARYLQNIFLYRVLAIVLTFGALLQILNLIDSTSDVLARGGGIFDVGRHAVLQLPILIAPTIPLAVLIASLTTLWSLANRNEIVAMRACGFASYQVLIGLAPAVLIVAAGQFFLVDGVVPPAERALIDWRLATDVETETTKTEEDKLLWFRVENSIVAVRNVADHGHRIEGIVIYTLDGAEKLTERIRATEARYGENGWMLTDVRREAIAGNASTVTRAETMPWQTSLEPANLIDIQSQPRNLSANRSRAILEGAWVGTRSSRFYEVRLQRLYAGPAMLFVMVLLTIPVAHGVWRGHRTVLWPGISLGLGLVYLLVDGMLRATGEAGIIPPFLAAWAATGIFASVGGTLLVRLEG